MADEGGALAEPGVGDELLAKHDAALGIEGQLADAGQNRHREVAALLGERIEAVDALAQHLDAVDARGLDR